MRVSNQTDYREARDSLSSGDLMVLNRAGLIARHSRGRASHVGLLAWREADQRSLSVAESREGVGARVVSLSSQVRAFPGAIDIYTPISGCTQLIRERTATTAYNWAGRSYDYPGVLRRGLVHLPLLYELAHVAGYHPDLTDLLPTTWEAPKVCSDLVAWSYRRAKLELHGLLPGGTLNANDEDRRTFLAHGWDPCPGLGNRWVEPNDLVRSGSFRLLAKGLVIDD